MALETLHGVKEIGGFEVDHGYTKDHQELDEKKYVYVSQDANCIGFKIQNGPIKEVGVNGCQVDTLIEAARLIIEGLNEKFPCQENRRAINGLCYALDALRLRKINRELRGVEGTSNP